MHIWSTNIWLYTRFTLFDISTIIQRIYRCFIQNAQHFDDSVDHYDMIICQALPKKNVIMMRTAFIFLYLSLSLCIAFFCIGDSKCVSRNAPNSISRNKIGNPTNPRISCNGTFYCFCSEFRPETIEHRSWLDANNWTVFNCDTVGF